MANLPLFKQAQYEFAAHIRDPESNPKPADVDERRMKIYNELFFNNVEDFIATTYPVLKKIIPENKWQNLIRDYFHNHLSKTPLFPEMPREFLKYLETERNNPEDFPFIKELAHYEWVELALLTSDLDESIAWKNINKEGDLLNGNAVISPLAWTLSYKYPVQHINSDYLPEAPSEHDNHILIYRDFEDEIHFMELNPITALLLQYINEDKNITTKVILETIAEQMNHPEPEVIIDGGYKIIQDLKDRNVILGTYNT